MKLRPLKNLHHRSPWDILYMQSVVVLASIASCVREYWPLFGVEERADGHTCQAVAPPTTKSPASVETRRGA
jgi:hypothetical protein